MDESTTDCDPSDVLEDLTECQSVRNYEYGFMLISESQGYLYSRPEE